MEPLGYFVGAAAVLAITQVVFRFVVRREYLAVGRLRWPASLAQYVAILAWVGFGWLNAPRDWPAVHVGAVQATAGWALFVGGWAVTLAGIARLGVFRSHGLQVSGLRTTGLYRLTRNPQAAAFVAAMVGYVALWPSWRNLGVLVLVAILCDEMIRAEEIHLRAVFGDEYERYREQVPRYLRLGRRAG